MTMITCWACQGPVKKSAITCQSCQAIQPPQAEASPFALLNISAIFEVDMASLEQAYFNLQLKTHPDRVRSLSQREQDYAEAQGAALNTAYEALKNPSRRAVALMRHKGWQPPEDGATLPPELLERQFSLREALDKAAGKEALNTLGAQVKQEWEVCLKKLNSAFAANAENAARTGVVELQFLQKFNAEIRLREAAARA